MILGAPLANMDLSRQLLRVDSMLLYQRLPALLALQRLPTVLLVLLMAKPVRVAKLTSICLVMSVQQSQVLPIVTFIRVVQMLASAVIQDTS